MELRHLRSFLVLAEELHFGRAAERLGIAQPPVSRHIQQLEAEVGSRLFERSPREVRLTAAGAALLSGAREHVAGLDRTLLQAKAAGAGQTGHLRVGYSSNTAYLFLPQVVAALRERAPQAILDLAEMPTSLQIEALREGRIDLGLATLPVDDNELMQRRLFAEELMAVLPADHALAAKKSLALADLASEPFLMCPRYQRAGFHEVILERCARVGFRPTVSQEVPSKALLAELIAAGMGVSLVPRSSATANSHRLDVAYRPLNPSLPPVEVAAIWDRRNCEPLRQVFLDLAVVNSAR